MAGKSLRSLTWLLFAVTAVAMAVGGVLQLVSNPHGGTLALGVLFIFLALANAGQAVYVYRHGPAERRSNRA